MTNKEKCENVLDLLEITTNINERQDLLAQAQIYAILNLAEKLENFTGE